jgi:hypothetical protein
LSVIFCDLASLREIRAAARPKNAARATIAWIGRGLVLVLQ